ncbi:2OG-Fe(II) oxygenase [Microbulbifer sp. SSSA002]|uniref:2OG-Fe(II) oxygenase n=1 Tax=unclassified Microbulbifer TaxID=2619833 RepID=UPI00403A2E68
MTNLATPIAPWLDANTITGRESQIYQRPFPFFIAENLLAEELMASFIKDFPQLKGAGYLPYDRSSCGTTINELIEQFRAPAFADAIGNNLGIENLSQYPTYVSISRTLKKRHGRIHTDGQSKIATALLYLNPEWSLDGTGCLRFLNSGDNFEDTAAPEVRPTYGTLAAFKRADNSFHGHLPFEGKRLVIQVAWLVSDADKNRKAKRGKFASKLKRLLGGFKDNSAIA